MKFSKALEALEEGHYLSRHSWGSAQRYINKTQVDIYEDCLVLHKPDWTRVLGWTPTSCDMFADDWAIADDWVIDR